MRTFKTIEEARSEAKKTEVHINKIIKIEHVTEAVVYIMCRATLSVLQANLSQLTEIKSLISEHSVESDEEIKALRAGYARDYKNSDEGKYKAYYNKINNAMTLNGRSL